MRQRTSQQERERRVRRGEERRGVERSGEKECERKRVGGTDRNSSERRVRVRERERERESGKRHRTTAHMGPLESTESVR